MDKTLIDERYELWDLAGSGGMADVYLAYDRVLDRHVAIKLPKARYASDEEFVERFRRQCLESCGFGFSALSRASIAR